MFDPNQIIYYIPEQHRPEIYSEAYAILEPKMEGR